DPSVSNDANAIQDTAGNDAITITIAAPVTNITPADITAPVFASAAVNGGTLVMTYNEALDAAHAPVAGNFAVAVGGVANVVTAVAVNAAAKTVVLTLTTPVINGNTVTVGYTDPSTGNDANAIQDAFGNDALSIATQTVINTTPIDTLAPVFAAAAVNGGTLVMTYNETLDAAHAPIAGSFAVAVGGVANAVTAVAVNAAAKTVVLTLTTPVVNGNVVTVGYTDPSVSNDANTIQDALGNDALSIATRTVINTTPIDTLAPVFAGAAVNGGTLVMTYNEALDAAHAPVAGNFAVAVEGVANAVTAVAVNAAAKTVVLTLTTPVINGNVVTVGYTDPSTGNDANAIQDALGNDAFSIAARTVIITTPADTLAPSFADAAVDGGTLVMTSNEALDAAHAPAAGNFAVAVEGVANAVTAVAVNAAAKTVTLTLSTPVVKGNTVTVGYTDPSIINDANAIQDASGNDALSIVTQTVTNNTPDSTAPVFAGAVVDGSSLVMTYSEALDAAHAPVAENFAVAVEGVANAVTAVIVDAAAMTVTLTLSTAVTHGAVVTVGYTDPSPGNDASAVQDAAGNDTLSIPAQAVTNNTPDTTAPIFAGASVNGNTLVMTYNEANTLDAIHTAATSAFAVKVNGDANAVTAVAVDATAKTVTLTLTTAVTTSAAVVTVAYTDPSTGNDANAVQDAVGNDAPSIAAQTVTNTTAPVFVSAFIDGATLVMAYNDATTLDAIHTAATTAFAVKVNGNSDAVASVAVNAAAKTVTLTLGNGVNYGDRVTVAYTDPSTGNDVNAIQNAAGYDAATIVAQTVTNYTSYPTPTDNTAPTIGSVTIASATGAVASTLNVGDVVSVTVPFSETVNVTGTPNLSLVIGSTLVQAAYASGTGTNSLTFTYTILANQTDANGISIAANALALNSGTIKDVAGNAATLTHAPVADNSSYLVDTAPPTVNTISIASATGIQASTLNTGDVMSITVPLTEVVTVTGTPQISLVIGNTDVLANYSTGTGTNSLTFTYTILAGQTDTNGIAIKINTLALNSGMIVDTAGNAATLANAAVTDNASYMVDTTAPTAPTGVTLTPQGGTVVVNAVNSTNTNLNIAATVVPGQATGGKAEFYVDTTKLGEDSSIAGGDSSVTYTTSDGTPINAELQTAIIAGGVVTVKLFDAAGNNATSTASNPTLAVDYTSASIIPFTTVGAESVIGTSGNDTFTATYGDGLAGTFNGVGDILNGDTGTDTLNITIGAEATTSLDADWTNISNIEKVVFNSLGNGAQSITAGTLFNAAFTTANVDLTAQTLLGAISIDMNTVVKNATITTTTIGDGAHTITTGSGVTTVNATALAAGAQTINGVGLATVNATVNGAGDQIIGTTHGENLVTVNATIVGAGAQTITSTSGSDATVNATAAAGVQTIVTGVGNDTVTTTGAAGQTNTITTNAGNDTIVASLGTDLITGGLGADSMTGGGATDTFAAGNNGSIIGTSMDVITDFNTAGADALTFDGITTLLTADATALVATSNVNTSTGGLITFAAGDNNLALKTAAIEADAELDAAGSIAMFVDSGNTYVYYAGAAIGPADDQLIQLTGIDTLVTITGGSTTVFA
ncbi:MAG: SwmB domain-containing protein, partial [Methylococcaceae bacterium]